MINLIENVSKLNNLPVKQLQKVCSNLESIIGHSIVEAYLNKDKYVIFNLGIGTLTIDISEEELTYKFIPSATLEAKLINAVNKKEDILVSQIEKSVVSKLIGAYKELI